MKDSSREKRFKLRGLLLIAGLWMGCAVCTAHDPGLSYGEFLSGDAQLTGRLIFNSVDLENLVGTTKVDTSDFEAVIAKRAADALSIEVDEKMVLPAAVKVLRGRAEDGRDIITFLYEYRAVPVRSLTVRVQLLKLLPETHRLFFKLQTPKGLTLAERLLTQDSLEARVQTGELLPANGKLFAFLEFLKLGLEHILTGYDHLCFLLALLLVADSYLGLLRIVTSFTIAHSITLALSALDKLTISPSITEPLIAVSIIYVALENIWRKGREVDERWVLTFGFGLIHGFGFASVLRELNIGASGSLIAVPLISFNLGVECGQLIVVAVLYPVIVWGRKRLMVYPRLMSWLSAVIALVGLYWLLQRTIGVGF